MATMTAIQRSDANKISTPERAFAPNDAALWAALTEDSGAAVIALSSSGAVLAVSSAAYKLFGVKQKPDGVTGDLNDLFESALARERLQVVSEVIASGKPLAIEGMVAGRMIRSVLRPLAGRNGSAGAVVMVSRLGTEADGLTGVRARRAEIDDLGPLAGLTSRELEILKLIGLGLSTADIAEKLGRSVKTVEWHRVSLGEKLGISNRVELARIAIAAGLVASEAIAPQPN
ncbi:MAG: hypothetical protein JSR77_00960 [Planctomycetes bacterium]|nr:hypothetical protein [Planctomycetota bacterium]